MYEPPLHRQDDLAALHELIRRRPLGLIVNRGAQGLAANAVPFLIDAGIGRFGRLRAHVARANGLWRELQGEAETLVVFQDVDHYISPSWYATKRETGKVVPTWNYVMVQARGTREGDRGRGLAARPDRRTHRDARRRPRRAMGGRRCA